MFDGRPHLIDDLRTKPHSEPPRRMLVRASLVGKGVQHGKGVQRGKGV